MSEQLKERMEIEEKDRWDLSSLYADDQAWEKALAGLDEVIAKVAAFAGTLTDAHRIAELMKAENELDLLLSDLFVYANLRKSEDTRADDAQQMYARIYGKYVQAIMQISFINPEILSLPEAELQKVTEAEEIAPYRFLLEKLLDQKKHVLSAEKEELLAGFGEVFAAPREIASNLMNAEPSLCYPSV